ncbi:MAG TPA: hypothetical protein VLG44_04990 [Chlamydiales bacterium]|nr:hypothetical protein [Chlamydiales bacterium]
MLFFHKMNTNNRNITKEIAEKEEKNEPTLPLFFPAVRHQMDHDLKVQ